MPVASATGIWIPPNDLQPAFSDYAASIRVTDSA
ncbi:hypothetical protein K227x_00750 [Rubripirellula lacrimiformis]|uniref:Uncharacterized protein n=1 Tax=Rubripirellula lacrimiformis TaxID=1930273 RepID=A0A517N3Y4_9BACT|nr:hypothetical protein K227x_00750 [Rubripirellula lacrimiformis]